jgi:hypothetical protein
VNTKSLARLEIKDADKGLVEAVFATLDKTDKDKDVTLKGAFEDGAPVRISAWGHSSWPERGARLPVGKGAMRETKSEAVMDGQFFMDTTDGRDTFGVVKALTEDDGPGQEWSYGFDVLDSERGEKDGERVRFLKKLKVYEVSPVLVGAGDTRTLALKGVKELPGGRTVNEIRDLLRTALDETIEVPEDGNAWLWVRDFTDEWVVYELEGSGWDDPGAFQADYTIDDDGNVTLSEAAEVEPRVEYEPKSDQPGRVKFAEEVDAAIAAVTGVLDRTAEVITFREAQGKSRLAEHSVERLARLDAETKRLDAFLREPESSDDLHREFLHAIARDLA